MATGQRYLLGRCPALLLIGEIRAAHASQEQTLGGKKWPSVVNPLGMFYIVLGTIKAKNEKNWLGNIAFTA